MSCDGSGGSALLGIGGSADAARVAMSDHCLDCHGNPCDCDNAFVDALLRENTPKPTNVSHLRTKPLTPSDMAHALYRLRGNLECSWWSSLLRARTDDGDRSDVKDDRDRRAERLLLYWWKKAGK